jgi:uncharacterized protein YbjT (DUF2867 family)
VTTTSEISFAGDGQVTSDVLLLGAAGNSGRAIAAELAARGLSVRLAGRRRGPLEDLARALAAGGATADVRTVDAGDAASTAGAIAGAGVVLSTIGPFARQAGPVIDACLAARVPYVDIANEWPAVRGLLDRDEQARAHAVALVTGAGFGPAATETLVLRLVERMGAVPDLVRVAAAAGVTRQSDRRRNGPARPGRGQARGVDRWPAVRRRSGHRCHRRAGDHGRTARVAPASDGRAFRLTVPGGASGPAPA